jgi:hypothetical protein
VRRSGQPRHPRRPHRVLRRPDRVARPAPDHLPPPARRPVWNDLAARPDDRHAPPPTSASQPPRQLSTCSAVDRGVRGRAWTLSPLIGGRATAPGSSSAGRSPRRPGRAPRARPGRGPTSAGSRTRTEPGAAASRRCRRGRAMIVGRRAAAEPGDDARDEAFRCGPENTGHLHLLGGRGRVMAGDESLARYHPACLVHRVDPASRA